MVDEIEKAEPLVEIGIGELAVVGNGGRLVSYSLGSCVALALYDPVKRIAGMAHVMLPRAGRSTPAVPAKSAPEAVSRLLEAVEAQGASRKRLTARLVGGASLFGAPDARGTTIGARNVAALKELLAAERIPLVAEDTGGHSARTVVLSADDGALKVRTVARGEYEV